MTFIPQSPLSPSGMTASPNILGRFTAENLKASVSRIPNTLRLAFRFVQLFSSLATFCFSLAANTKGQGLEIPFRRLPALTFLYVTAAFSFAASIFFIIDYYRRRMEYRVKIKRVYLIGVDSIIFIFWLSDLCYLFSNVSCPIGTLEGWCDFLNTSLFFGVLSMSVCFICLLWDILGTWFQD